MAETLRILIADDEPGMRMGVARSLRNFSVHVRDVNGEVTFEVDEASSGEAALEKIRETRPDILLLDYKLPGITGLEVLDEIRPLSDDVLTIMITAYASLETAVSATKRGAYDFLAKPFTPDDLRNSIRKAAGRLLVTRQARRLAQEKRQLRFQFISVLAHELKAPLSAVEGYLQIVKGRTAGDDPAVYDHMVERCLLRTQHMRKLVMDLLDMTRIESGQKKREPAEVSVREVAQTAIETVRPSAMERDIEIELHCDDAAMMQADRGEMEIILNNLISNAVKYNRDGGRVDIDVHRDADGTMVIKVSDTGIGMTEEEVGKLFADFMRIKNEKTRGILGSGLGLSILRKLARMYGGDVSVESKSDVGSTFTVALKDMQAGDESATADGATAAIAETDLSV